MITFAQFLHHQGLKKAELSAEELVQLKTDHRKEYKRLWRQERNKKTAYRQLDFTREEFRLIERAAKRHQQPFSRFAINAIMAYLKRNYIVLDEFQVQELRLGLKRLGVNLNQIAFHTNRSQNLHHQDLIALQHIMKKLEAFLLQVLTRPDDLNELVRAALKQHPEYRQVLQEILNEPQSK